MLLFSFGQSVHRRIQAAGLQQQHNDLEDRTLKNYALMFHVLLAFAIAALRRECPTELLGVYDDFKGLYLRWKPNFKVKSKGIERVRL